MGPIEHPQSALLQRSTTKQYPEAVSGDGVYIIQEDGTRILDGCSGAAISCLGHSEQVVIDAIVEQARKLSFVHGSFFTNRPAEELAQHFISLSDGAFSKAVFLSSGSEAIETAIKLARHYHLCKQQPKRTKYIARYGSYHGNTIGALSASFNPVRREPFEPILSPVFRHASACHYSRDGLPGEREDDYVDQLALEMEQLFIEEGPSTVAAVIVEPVVGATLGAVPAAKGYLRRLRQLCDRYGSLLIFDEVMCGLGRVGTTHAWQSLGGVQPDLQTIGKGLAAGYQPISGVLISPTVADQLEQSSKANAFRTIDKRDLLGNVRRVGELLEAQLRSRVPCVGEVRGMGLFLGVELAGPMASRVTDACLERGAAVYLCSPVVNAIILAPPFILTPEEAHDLVEMIREAVLAVSSNDNVNA
ncbi:uncharacterized protein LTR77_010941 [Saxophila tyrrhenica]|uniref:Uncharacterized protein n=1 Tax=Saxophila tyrrhenica TaxID=1690608 RepID=A0AAV9NWS4_9PEZI|nr:hypothetical protein LTR77_010941 [Saxophila tyrrhenica]